MLLDFAAVGFIDITGVEELQSLLEEAAGRNIRVAFMGVHLPVKKIFQSSGFWGRIETDLFIETRGDAIAVLFQKLDHTYCREVCPHALFSECPTVK